MTRVLCGVDDRPGSVEAAHAAIDYCRENGAELTLVGVVRPMLTVTQPAGGELIRRFQGVEQELLEACRAARKDGIEASIVIRDGDPAQVLKREAESAGASEIFLAHTRSRLSARFTGEPRVQVTRIAVPVREKPVVVELAVAA
jgi:nucleotide-binding universal stress UspA family protein